MWPVGPRGPCRWPHYSTLETLADGPSTGRGFQCGAPRGCFVRAKIKAGVETERLIGPDGRLSEWRVYKNKGGLLEEVDHA